MDLVPSRRIIKWIAEAPRFSSSQVLVEVMASRVSPWALALTSDFTLQPHALFFVNVTARPRARLVVFS